VGISNLLDIDGGWCPAYYRRIDKERYFSVAFFASGALRMNHSRGARRGEFQMRKIMRFCKSGNVGFE
jgi:hypothetical protein